MPRLKKTDEEIRFITMKGNIAKRQEIKGFSDLELARLIGLSERRFAEKRRDPSLFTYPEISRLIIRLGLTDEEVLEGLKG